VPWCSCLHYCRKWNLSLFFLPYSSDVFNIQTGDVLRCRYSHTALKDVSSRYVIIVRFWRNLVEASCTKCRVDKRLCHLYDLDNMSEFSPLRLCPKNLNILLSFYRCFNPKILFLLLKFFTVILIVISDPAGSTRQMYSNWHVVTLFSVYLVQSAHDELPLQNGWQTALIKDPVRTAL
jgi:hypothetical protein